MIRLLSNLVRWLARGQKHTDEFLVRQGRGFRGPLALYGITVVILFLASGRRAQRQSTDPHFVVLADAWLHGRLDVTPPPGHNNDWARVTVYQLTSGERIAGRALTTEPGRFRTLDGREIDTPAAGEIASQSERVYVSFPPFPSVLMLPGVAVAGRRFNDVAFTIFFAGLAPALFLLLLRRVRQLKLGLDDRSETELYVLSLSLPLGTVFFYSSIIGQVWYTAHVFGVLFALGYALCALGARRPLLAGLFVGVAFVTRTPMLFVFPLLVLESWRVHGGRAGLRKIARDLALFAAPIMVIGLAAAWFNQVRFGSPFEFGHSYLVARQQAEIEHWGLFHVHYLGRNLAAAFTLLPQLSRQLPHIKIHGHGMSLLLTTPIFLFAVWPRSRGPLHRALWLTVLAVAVPIFLYQNSGWVQFGFRFSLDFTVFLLLLVALSGRPILSRVGVPLLVLAFVVNAFGAYAFAHKQGVYFDTTQYENLFPTQLR